MGEPTKLSDAVGVSGVARKHVCGWHPKDPRSNLRCDEPCESFLSGDGDVRHVRYTGLCRMHGELEYSERWQRRLAEAGDDIHKRSRLIDERAAWEAKGHLYRGTSDRAFVDRRAGHE